jgi:pyruvate kinase
VFHVWYTDGPSSRGKERELLNAGANGVRLTFSYGTPDLLFSRAQEIKEIARRAGAYCQIIADIAGEKFRLGAFEGTHSIRLSAGTRVQLVNSPVSAPESIPHRFPIPSSVLMSMLKSGMELIVGDGAAVLRVLSVDRSCAVAEMKSDGVLNQNRGLTILNSRFQPRCLTDKDLSDLDHVLSRDVYDIVALSFVSSASEISTVKRLATAKNRQIPILAKIETPEGLENLESICRTTDLVMAARGDLALTMPWTELPQAVSAIGRSACTHSRTWILATQIAEGLEQFSMLTRAEICDLARWLEEGCGGILFSHETAFGSHPVAAVTSAAKLIQRWSSRPLC